MTSTDICNILECCSKNGVYLLQLGDLYVEFNHKPIELIEPIEDNAIVYKDSPDIKNSNIEEKGEQDYSELILSDPLAYEELESGDING